MGLTAFEKRLAWVLLGYGLLQAGIFGIFSAVWSIPQSTWVVFLSAHGAYFVVLLLAFSGIRGDFRSLDGQPLKRIGVPNLLTLFRLTSLPVMTTLFLLARDNPELSVALVIYIGLAFLTDLLDGFLARTFGWGTQLGKLLDSSTDYMIVFSLAIVLGVTGVLPLWLLILILGRLSFQVVGLAWMAVRYKKRVVETTFWGKASLFILMVLFTCEILVFLRLPGLENAWYVTAIEWVTAAIMVISTLDKALFFRKHWGEGVKG